MRLGLDGRALQLRQGTGVATYAAGLREACLASGADVILVTDRPAGAGAPERTHTLPCKLQRLVRAAMPAAARENGGLAWRSDLFRVAQVHFNLHGRLMPLRMANPPDIMHWTYPLPLYVPGARNVYTVHDLIPVLHPALTAIDGPRMTRLLRRVIERAERVVTVTEAVRADMLATFGMAPERVVTLGQSVVLPGTVLEAARSAPLLVPADALVHVGLVEPRKNIARLIRAHGRSGIASPLVLIGPDGPGASEEMRAAAAHPRGPQAVIRIPWIERPALIRALQASRALLFPSLAEGFGLPVAEAMALGVPVVTSGRHALAEVAGDAALLVDPEDEAALAEAIGRIAHDGVLRADLVERGLRRSGLFAQAPYAARLRDFHAALLADGFRS